MISHLSKLSHKIIFTINRIVEDSSGAFDTAGTANRSSDVPEFNVVGFLLRGPLLIVLDLWLNSYFDPSII